MKTTSGYLLRFLPRGIISLPMIVLFALMLTSSLVFIMRRGLSNKDAAAHIQMRTDYRQREDAFVRALIAIVPNKAIGCMQNNAAAHSADLTWNQIFTEALAASNGGVALNDADIAALALPGGAGAISSNTGNDAGLNAAGLLVPLVTDAGDVVAGNTSNAALFNALPASDLAKLPPTLSGPANVLNNDNTYPIISRSKVIHTAGANADYALSPATYPVHNQVRFPNVRLSFANPGDYVVGKRNWWAFSINYGNGNLGTIQKKYLLSIYELPNQLPISATATTSIGTFSTGVAWNAANIVTTGAVFADRLTTTGAMNFQRVMGRESLQLGGGKIGGAALNGNVDDLGTREVMAAANKSNFLPAAVASNSGKVAYMALKRGSNFYTEAPAEANTLSDTSWDKYTRGSNQCSVKVYITGVVAATNQLPTTIVVNYKDAGGADVSRTFTRSGAVLLPSPGVIVPPTYWPEPQWAGDVATGIPSGADMPFQTTAGPTGRPMLEFYPKRFAKWVESQGGAAVNDPNFPNNTFYIAPNPALDPTGATIAPSIPSINGDLAVVMRDPLDLSAYKRGLALVTSSRYYLGEDTNQVPITPPANAGLDPNALFYPPLSIFSPEYRVGTAAGVRPLDISGQVASITTEDPNNPTTFNPLDFRSGGTDAVDAENQLSANLKQIISPAELPPVVNMNWLFTVEELH